MEQKKKIIGITGGVGAGKSSVLAGFEEGFWGENNFGGVFGPPCLGAGGGGR